ncbi:hypothetical protein [Budvicia aquatica]|uniref:Uncharacterized protein n=1 Tax=Budvicia aquatica TaxID=82979 RepID=A0A2C6CYE0_9GAMM|nr:hypothetical protein [Budvicia aquatica]PHI31699.1 hypothetical protein CRN84_21380 [Budvicia aquatica]VFS52493.1 Uncharacterised protein [Budvicia aquatica]
MAGRLRTNHVRTVDNVDLQLVSVDNFTRFYSGRWDRIDSTDIRFNHYFEHYKLSLENLEIDVMIGFVVDGARQEGALIRISGSTHTTGSEVRGIIQAMPGNPSVRAQISSNSPTSIEFLLTDHLFAGFKSYKITSFLGGIGEANVWRKLSNGVSGSPAIFNIYSKSIRGIKTIAFTPIEGTIMHFQKIGCEHGIDIVFQILNPQNPSQKIWVILEIKTTSVRSDSLTTIKRYQGDLSEPQRIGDEYFIRKLNEFLAKPRIYGSAVGDSKYNAAKQLLKDFEAQMSGTVMSSNSTVVALALGQSVDQKFSSVSSAARVKQLGLDPDMMFLSGMAGEYTSLGEKLGVVIPRHTQMLDL